MNSESHVQFLSSSYWQQLSFFKDVPSDAIKDLLADSEVVSTNAKTIVFYEAELASHFGFVIEGVFKLYRTPQAGQRVIMDFVTCGGMIAGLLMAADDSNYPVTVQSIGPGKFLKIPKTTYNKFWYNCAYIMKKVQIANMQRVQSLQTMREAQRFPLEKKVAWVLFKILGKNTENNNYLKVCFTRADIADAIGASSESVIRVFSLWMKAGIIESKKDEEFVNLTLLNEKFQFGK